MKKIILKALLLLLSLQASTILSMDAPDGWKPIRPSGSGRPPRPRPQAVYGATPLAADTQPIVSTATPALAPTHGPAPMNPMHIINTQTPAQPQVTNPMHIINTGIVPATATQTPLLQGMSDKERERVGRIRKDLDKIDESLKEMGWGFGEGALSAAGFDPIGTVGGVGTGLYHLGKITVLYGRVLNTSSKLSKGSPQARAARDDLLPRIAKINSAIETIKSKFSSAKTAK